MKDLILGGSTEEEGGWEPPSMEAMTSVEEANPRTLAEKLKKFCYTLCKYLHKFNEWSQK